VSLKVPVGGAVKWCEMMFSRFTPARSQEGFTLIELLVVILIVGVLAAIALPMFLGQRTKAQDAEAKVYAVAAQKALEIFHTQHETYAGAGQADLAEIEGSLADARGMSITGTDATFDVAVDSVSGDKGGGNFAVARGIDDSITRTCENAGRGSCQGDGTW
jgi:type IV pilus assembly protein PilA